MSRNIRAVAIAVAGLLVLVAVVKLVTRSARSKGAEASVTLPPSLAHPPATCTPDDSAKDAAVPPPEAGVVQSSETEGGGPFGSDILGTGVANPYYEVGVPDDGVHDHHPLGVMLEIHGGGWVQVGANTTEALRPDADFWRTRGWETVNLDYRGCWRSVGDVVAVYRRVRQVVGPHLAICASGQSSGGSLALIMAAVVGRGLSCVISQAGITDLAALATAKAYPSTVPGDSPAGLTAEVVAAFHVASTAALAEMSPITYAASFSTPALLASAVNDPVVPLSQAAGFQNAVLARHPGIHVAVDQLPCPAQPNAVLCQQAPLAAGDGPAAVTFVHGSTSAYGLAGFYQQEIQLAATALTESR